MDFVSSQGPSGSNILESSVPNYGIKLGTMMFSLFIIPVLEVSFWYGWQQINLMIVHENSYELSGHKYLQYEQDSSTGWEILFEGHIVVVSAEIQGMMLKNRIALFPATTNVSPGRPKSVYIGQQNS